MFAYCEKCDYETEDFDEMKSLEDRVMSDGGEFGFTHNTCPKCKNKDCLQVD
jgi:hypothetical protein